MCKTKLMYSFETKTIFWLKNKKNKNTKSEVNITKIIIISFLASFKQKQKLE